MAVTKILLTGASGRIGRTYFRAMRASYDFILTDLNRPDYTISSPHTFIQADLSIPGAAKQLLTESKPDVIVHLAGIPDANAR